MTDTIRIGVVGAHSERGWGRWVHLPALTGLDDYTLTAVASTSQESADAAAHAWGASLAFGDAHELLNHPDVDLVTIAVQLPRREGLIDGAIRAGKHVYSEWPVALDAATAAGYRDAAVAAGVQSAVGLQSRHHPAVRFVADLLEEDSIGDLLSASLTYSLPAPETASERYADLFDAEKGVNHLTIVGGHSLNMFCQMAGAFTEVSATMATRISPVTILETGHQVTVTSPDQIAVSGSLESGAVGSAQIMTGGPAGEGFRIAFHGRRGRLVLASRDASLVAPQLDVTLDEGDGAAPLPVPDRYQTPSAAEGPVVANVRQVYRDLAESIRGGTATGPDLTTAVQTHRLLDAIKRSVETGNRQPVG
ncbi:Gfo/Idh/MocA family protein [Micromonospora sp. DT31]|uniref:Gfo/Idh/MocA family protein n=1 Tax=Micromonospora sp. DT31 TaxID=3393434 RepID=UPI003CED16AF